MTTNPFMIMVVNMTIVFVVLFLLGLVIEVIHKLDPTRKNAQQEADEIVAYVETVMVIEEEPLTREDAEKMDYEAIMDKESTIK